MLNLLDVICAKQREIYEEYPQAKSCWVMCAEQTEGRWSNRGSPVLTFPCVIYAEITDIVLSFPGAAQQLVSLVRHEHKVGLY